LFLIFFLHSLLIVGIVHVSDIFVVFGGSTRSDRLPHGSLLRISGGKRNWGRHGHKRNARIWLLVVRMWIGDGGRRSKDFHGVWSHGIGRRESCSIFSNGWRHHGRGRWSTWVIHGRHVPIVVRVWVRIRIHRISCNCLLWVLCWISHGIRVEHRRLGICELLVFVIVATHGLSRSSLTCLLWLGRLDLTSLATHDETTHSFGSTTVVSHFQKRCRHFLWWLTERSFHDQTNVKDGRTKAHKLFSNRNNNEKTYRVYKGDKPKPARTMGFTVKHDNRVQDATEMLEKCPKLMVSDIRWKASDKQLAAIFLGRGNLEKWLLPNILWVRNQRNAFGAFRALLGI
jgi:hypothetical protein